MATILIVDDLSGHRATLVSMLGGQGHRLLEASNGREALATAQAEPPDLVITDVLMPIMDGYELVRKLRECPTTVRVPVLFYTAPYGEREARAIARSSGVPFVLRKPARPDEVLKIVDRMLAGLSASWTPTDTAPPSVDDRAHLRLLTDKLPDDVGGLRVANAKLRALFNIGLELASRPDTERLLESVCGAAHDLFGAAYVTLGVVDRSDLTVQRVVACGTGEACWSRPGEAAPGVLGRVVSLQEPLRGENPGGDPVALELPSTHPPIHAYLAAPLSSSDRVYGWLCLAAGPGCTFTEDDEQLLMALSGQVGRLYELEHEIVERKQAEGALREERDRSQRFLDTAEVILLTLTLEGRIALVNRYACTVLGWKAEELLGRDWVETCCPTRSRAAVRARFDEVVRGNLSVVESPIVTRSGEERLFEWRNTTLRDETGAVIGTFSSGTDITERELAVEALRTTEERVRFALEAAGVGVWDMDYATGVLQWTPLLEAQYGLAPGTFGGTFEAFAAGIHPEDRAEALETLRKSMQSGTDFSLLHRVVWPDGTTRWLRGAGRIHRDADGLPVRGIGTSQDITERRTLEEQYQQAQKMEAVGRLAGGVAHDFNNLLTVILSLSDLAIAELGAGDPLREALEEIRKAGERAATLTRQLLLFSRQQVIGPKVVDLSDILAGMQKMLPRLIGEDVELVTVAPRERGRVRVDPNSIEQVVMNLVVNARDAMPTGGKLTIETGNVVLDEAYARVHHGVTAGPHVMLAVSDTGYGMDKATISRIFEPFFTTREQGKGTGLGLSTVFGIVKQNLGSIWVYSEPGHGTTFKVYLPRVDAEIDVLRSGARVEQRRGSETVLLVEDEAQVRSVMRNILRRLGYEVIEASNGGEALLLCEQYEGTIDLLLTDVVMPRMSGPELAGRLARIRPEMKVLCVSGYTDDSIVRHGVISASFAFLQKPITPETLARKIREVLDAPPG